MHRITRLTQCLYFLVLFMVFGVAQAVASTHAGVTPPGGVADGTGDHTDCLTTVVGVCIETTDLIVAGVAATTAVVIGLTFGNSLGLAGGGGLAIAVYLAHIPIELALFGAAGATAWKGVPSFWNGEDPAPPVEPAPSKP